MMAHDDEILTAYLDGELEPQERREVEARLEAQPELRKQLEALRAASKAVQNLPSKKAPASILAAVRGEIAQGGEGKGQVIRAGEQFAPAARPNRWRTRLISVAAMLAVGVMIFVAVKASLLHGSKEMTAQAPKDEPAAVMQSPQAKEGRARNEEAKAADAKYAESNASEESDAMDVVVDSTVPAAGPPAETRALKAQPYASGKPAEMEQNGGTADRFRAAAEKAPELAKAKATGGGEAKELQRGKTAPAKAGAPDRFGGAEGAGAGKPARSLDEAKVATRDSAAAAKELDGAVAQDLETGSADMPKPAAPPSPPAAAAKAEQQLAQAGSPQAAPTAKPRANAAASAELAEGGEAGEQLAVANAADGKPADGKPADGDPNLKSESRKYAEAKDRVPTVTAEASAKRAAQAAPTVIRLRAGDPEKARSELLALAAAQGGRELAQDVQADKAQLRRGIGTTTAEADDAQKAGELLVAEALKESKAEEPKAPQAPGNLPESERANKAVEGEKAVEPSAGLALADRKDAKADAEAIEKREAREPEKAKPPNRAAIDPAGQPKVVRLVLQVPASKKAALLAALQQEANRHRSERQSGRPETLGGGIGHAPEAPKQDRGMLDSGDQTQAKKEEARREAARKAPQDPRPNEDSAAPAAAAPAEALEVIEVLIEVVP